MVAEPEVNPEDVDNNSGVMSDNGDPDMVVDRLRLNITNLSQEQAGFGFDIPEGVVVSDTPRRSTRLKATPKEHNDYTGGDKLDEVLGVKKSTSPKERKRKQIKAKYKS